MKVILGKETDERIHDILEANQFAGYEILTELDLSGRKNLFCRGFE
jgi:hypothetical protein